MLNWIKRLLGREVDTRNLSDLVWNIEPTETPFMKTGKYTVDYMDSPEMWAKRAEAKKAIGDLRKSIKAYSPALDYMPDAEGRN